MKFHPEHNNLLQFSLLNSCENIEHFSTTRIGGVSSGAFSSLNLGNYSDDSSVKIYQNRVILANQLFKKPEDFIVPHQTHGTRVLHVDFDFLKKDNSEKIDILYGVDATFTAEKDIFLCVTTADCVPLLVYDTEKQVIAAIHAGWRGTAGRIVEKTIVAMRETYGCNTENMLVGIGPAINVENYEVGDEVVQQFVDAGFDLSGVSLRKSEFSNLHIDLKKINRRELLRLGVPEKNIEKTSYCTFTNEKLFFSARRQTVHSGRMLSGILLKK